MIPTYKPGDVLLGVKWFRPKVGQVVVAQTTERIVIKRIIRLDAKSVWVEGDNRGQSTDSRHFGSLARDKLKALIILKVL